MDGNSSTKIIIAFGLVGSVSSDVIEGIDIKWPHTSLRFNSLWVKTGCSDPRAATTAA